MPILLPRLPAIAAESLLDEFLMQPSVFSPDTTNLPRATSFAATGGPRVTPSQLDEVRALLVDLAREHGMDGGRNDRARFDAAAASKLAERLEFASGEALRDDTWTFVGVVLAPDVVRWRFGDSRERYLGGIRNTFQRLWARGQVLDRGTASTQGERWGLLEKLTEDALVQITERPSLAAHPNLARPLAEAWVRAAERYGIGKMQEINRRAVKLTRIRNEIRSLSLLDPDELGAVLDELFTQVAEH